MFSLLYASRAKEEFDQQRLVGLCAHAAVKNSELDITGYLYFRNGSFFQYLEGSEEAVLGLMTEISHDERHQVIQISHGQPIVERRFPTWGMQYLQVNTVVLEDVIIDHLKLLEFAHIGSDTYDKLWQTVDRLAAMKHLQAS